MGAVSDTALKRAEAVGKTMLESEPRAATVRYETGRIVIELTNGCSCSFPPALVQDLQNADASELANVRVDGYGFNLNFPALDVDLYVPALVAGIFGTQAWMTREPARIAGRKTSAAKASAARTNGSKGGRRRKVARD